MNARRGLTLLEVVVVIAIIGILLAMILPAIQYSREASRRMECSNRLRQIMIAVHNYELTYRILPPSGSSTGGLFSILSPHLEQQGAMEALSADTHRDVFIERSFSRRAPFFNCPSDPSSKTIDPHFQVGATSYVGNLGSGYLW